MPSAVQAATNCSLLIRHPLAKLSFAHRVNGVFACQPLPKCKLVRRLARRLVRRVGFRPARPSRQQVETQQRIPGSLRSRRAGKATVPMLRRRKPFWVLTRLGAILITRHQERFSWACRR